MSLGFKRLSRYTFIIQNYPVVVKTGDILADVMGNNTLLIYVQSGFNKSKFVSDASRCKLQIVNVGENWIGYLKCGKKEGKNSLEIYIQEKNC